MISNCIWKCEWSGCMRYLRLLWGHFWTRTYRSLEYCSYSTSFVLFIETNYVNYENIQNITLFWHYLLLSATGWPMLFNVNSEILIFKFNYFLLWHVVSRFAPCWLKIRYVTWSYYVQFPALFFFYQSYHFCGFALLSMKNIIQTAYFLFPPTKNQQVPPQPGVVNERNIILFKKIH